MSIHSHDIERKQNFDIYQGPYLCYKFAKNDVNNPNLDLVNINVYTKFG